MAKRGDRIGTWTLEKRLGTGGNAVVWQATSPSHSAPVALKILKDPEQRGEPYKRFAREIEFVRGLGNFAGVLPVLAANVAEDPGGEPAWLAMPIATPIDEALAGAGLEGTVSAITGIAETLARLAEQHDGFGHRDIKPGNLYERDGEWLVGDFGLVDVPDASEKLTRTGRPLGPRYFMADEMIRGPATAAAGPADVFSLGKTLWVLAAGQRYPPAGPHSLSRHGTSLGEWLNHPLSHILDQLIDRMTRDDPLDRPSMAEVRQELERWLLLSAEPVTVEVRDAAAQVRASLAGEIAAQEKRTTQRELAIAAVRRFQEMLRPLDDALLQAHPGARIGVADSMIEKRFRMLTRLGYPETVWDWIRCSLISSGPDYNAYVLRLGRGLQLTVEGKLIASVLVESAPEKCSGLDFTWAGERTAQGGTAELEAALQELASETAAELNKGLAAFARRVAAYAA